MQNRTDLAIELNKIKENEVENVKKYGKIKAIYSLFEKEEGIKKGKYVTIRTGDISLLNGFEDLEKAIIEGLDFLLPKERKTVLLVGLGNNEITCDNIGPKTASKILATRHITEQFKKIKEFKNMNSVCVMSPGVLGKTGLEAGETVACVVEKIKPDCVIVIDALCANTTKNLFSVIQLCDSGIAPGSGVKNTRKELSFKTLGVPTVAIGVPTVVTAKAIAKELSKEKLNQEIDLIVTPKDADLLSLNMCEAIAQALNLFLQPQIDREIILSLV